MARVTELYHAYEEFNNELILLNPNDNHKDKFTNVQERFYSFAGKIDELLNTIVSDNSAVVSNDAASLLPLMRAPRPSRRIKLSETSLLNFDGRYENWLSFQKSIRCNDRIIRII